MEVYIFMITIGVLIALLLISIGICIGRGLNVAERVSEGKLLHNNSSYILHSNNDNRWNRDLGDDDGK